MAMAMVGARQTTLVVRHDISHRRGPSRARDRQQEMAERQAGMRRRHRTQCWPGRRRVRVLLAGARTRHPADRIPHRDDRIRRPVRFLRDLTRHRRRITTTNTATVVRKTA